MAAGHPSAQIQADRGGRRVRGATGRPGGRRRGCSQRRPRRSRGQGGRRPGPNSAGPDSGQSTVLSTQGANPGPWTDTTDLRATELHLLGLSDDYQGDGQVITPLLTSVPPRQRSVPEQQLAACYKQLNASVGAFGAYTLIASTNAVESTSTGDAKYKLVNSALLGLEKARDALAGQVKVELAAAASGDTAIRDPLGQVFACQAIILGAHLLAATSAS